MTAKILVIYSAEPSFPPTDQQPGATRTFIAPYWVDAINGTPTQADLDAVLAPSPDTIRRKTFTDDAQVMDWTQRLTSANNDQIDAYFAANVTTAAQAIGVLKNLTKIVSHQLKAQDG